MLFHGVSLQGETRGRSRALPIKVPPAPLLRLHEHLVHVAPDPVLPRLDRLDQRMALRVEVLRRMAVLRRVAAAHVAAGQAEPEMDPGVAHLQALLAAAGVRFDVVDLIQMGTRDCRHRSPSSSLAAREWDRRGSEYNEPLPLALSRPLPPSRTGRGEPGKAVFYPTDPTDLSERTDRVPVSLPLLPAREGGGDGRRGPG